MDRDRVELALGEARRPVETRRQLALHPTHHHLAESLVTGAHAPGEALVIEQFEQRGEALQVSVVRSSGEEQPMLEVRHDLSEQTRALRIGRVAAAAGGRGVVCLVDDEQVVAPGVARLVRPRQRLAEAAERCFGLQVVDRGDQTREVRPRVDVDPPRASKLSDELAVDDPELEAELVTHLVTPLQLEVGRRDDQDAAGAIAKKQLLRDQTGLDRLAQPDVVGDQERNPGHSDRPDERVELIPVDLNTALEGGEVVPGVGVRRRAPTDGVEEGIEAARVVERRRLRESRALERARARFDLPYDLERLIRLRIVVNAAKRQEVLTGRGWLQGLTRKLVRLYVGDHPAPLPDMNELALLGNVTDCTHDADRNRARGGDVNLQSADVESGRKGPLAGRLKGWCYGPSQWVRS